MYLKKQPTNNPHIGFYLYEASLNPDPLYSLLCTAKQDDGFSL